MKKLFSTCTKCKIEKPAKSFGIHSSKKNGLRIYCTDCDRELGRARYKKNREHILEYIRKKYKKNREHLIEYKRKKYLKNKSKGLWNDNVIDKLALSPESTRWQYKQSFLNIWDVAFSSFQSTFQNINTRANKKIINREKRKYGSGYDVVKFRKYIYDRLVKRSGNKYTSNWVNIVGEMYYTTIAMKLTRLKEKLFQSDWNKRVKKIQTDTLTQHYRYN